MPVPSATNTTALISYLFTCFLYTRFS